MTKKNHKENKNLQTESPQNHQADQFDPGTKALSEALRISFVLLKVIMVALLVLFLVSGFKMVGSDEQALVLRLGKIRGAGENRILKPGPHWIFPYPIEEIVRIPVAKKISLATDSFWYYQLPGEMLPQGPIASKRIPPDLDPVKEGYCITSGEKENQITDTLAGNDYSIVHSKWQVIYNIDDPERFYRNVYVEDIKPGEIYFDIITESIKPLLRNIFDDTIVATMVNYTIDQARSSDERIAHDVKKLLQNKLDSIESGIKVSSVQLTDIVWPRQVDQAFLASIRASQMRQKIIAEAKTYAENTLNETAGPVARRLLDAIKDESVAGQQKELLWTQLAGAAQGKIAQARAYRTTVVEEAKANAYYLKQLLPEYRKRPKLVLQKIYQDAIVYVLDNVDEKIIIQPASGTKGKEIRILLNRDPSIKKGAESEK